MPDGKNHGIPREKKKRGTRTGGRLSPKNAKKKEGSGGESSPEGKMRPGNDAAVNEISLKGKKKRFLGGGGKHSGFRKKKGWLGGGGGWGGGGFFCWVGGCWF